jgi:large subunit ribosomal protein L15
MYTLHTIKKHPKSTKRRKVVGRGIGSGHGTYSTRGGKGQTARTGHSKMPAAFEGGRQPLVRQLPKLRGFKSLNDKAIAVPLTRLNEFNDGDVVTAVKLIEKGIVKKPKSGEIRVKIVGGTLNKKLTIKVPTTKTALEQITKAGGKVK